MRLSNPLRIKHPGTMIRLCTAILVLLGGSQALLADEVKGNLNVMMQITASCSVPSPSGNLTLPFSEARALTNQPLSYSVTITSSCTAGAAITSLAFGDGLHPTGDGTTRIRRMLNANITDTYLAYRLYRDSNNTQIKPTSFGECEGDNATDCYKILYDPPRSTLSQMIYGRIYDNTGAFANQYAVKGGIYNDSVVMTVNYD